MSKITKCNKCGKTFDKWDYEEDYSIHRTLGYGSEYDGSELELDLCCNCMKSLIEECVISPII